MLMSMCTRPVHAETPLVNSYSCRSARVKQAHRRRAFRATLEVSGVFDMYVGDYGNGMRDACIEADSTFSAGTPSPLKGRASVAWISRHADSKVPHQTLQNALTDTSDNVYSTCSIVREN